ncbi:DUF1992 domain-containing protein [Fictibacillus sp. WQ 8-8]|uniref:DnaJ family domain-containing protein n=1 Tax=Fictibacillus sp. WQ 8-8 TaxID=2938788 RepID=UPI0006A7E17F|nr:DUF1992 domain-containing protein [Fictibacillus sp. WQ 8-8]MCQ6267499.1 DUF1992 domain-containing protein [Fictibacillus sp. WQ 8-8]
MDFAFLMAEQRIKEAIDNGDFDHLPGKGKPLELEDLSSVPPELRIGYKILKNANILPEEVQLKKEMMTLQDLIDCCMDPSEKEKLKKKWNEKSLRFNSLMEKRSLTRSSVFGAYKDKIYKKF